MPSRATLYRQRTPRRRELDREYAKQRYHKDPDYQRKYRSANREKVNLAEKKRQRRQALRERGFTEESYQSLLNQQNNVCAICKQPNKYKIDWSLDHCHSTGKTRGILCLGCNSILGYAGDSIQVLQNAIEYLKYYAG